MRFVLFIIIISSSSDNIFAQGISNIWMGGYANSNGNPPYGGWRMDFSTGIPIIVHDVRNMNFDFTCATISDSLGNFLFATNGVIVMNSQGDTMMNGSGLNPGVYSSLQWFGDGLRLPQAALILQLPESSNLYYLFHLTVDSLGIGAKANYFYHSIIDINMDGGYGGVISKNQNLLNGFFAPSGIAACKHANGRDYWVTIHDRNGVEFYFFILSPSGINFSHSQSIGYRDGLGTYSFSPDGSRFGGYNTYDDFEIFDFDRCSGMLSNYRQVAINDSMVCFGSSFSPNSRYLYGSSTKYLYQIDASSNQPDTSLITVAAWDSTYSPNPPLATFFMLQQLAPDGKIYIMTGNSTLVLHTIDSPDSAGLACNVLQHSVALPSYNATVPNHPNYFLGALTGSPCDTLGVGMDAPEDVVLRIQPNPSNGNFQLIYPPQPETGTIEIFDVMGKRVYSGNIPPWSQLRNMAVTQFSSGVYVLKMYWKNKTGVIKLIKE